ncbi:hypothetical protein GCM10027093_73720 [Paraburkholderia jirisanensis]
MCIDTIQPGDAEARRYATLFATASPTTEGHAIDLAMQYGGDIADGNGQASGRWLNNAGRSATGVEQGMQYPFYVHRDGDFSLLKDLLQQVDLAARERHITPAALITLAVVHELASRYEGQLSSMPVSQRVFVDG